MRWMNPESLFFYLKLNPEQIWLDFGCGPGFFSIPMAKKVAKVIAVDVSREMLQILRKRANENGVSNMEYLEQGCPGDLTGVSDVNGVLMVNVLHEVEEPHLCLSVTSQKLKHNGMFVLVEWKHEPMEMGPPLDHRFTVVQIKEIIKKSGLKLNDRPKIYKYHDVYILSKP